LEKRRHQIQEVRSRVLPQLQAIELKLRIHYKTTVIDGVVCVPGTTIRCCFGQPDSTGVSRQAFDQSVFTGLKAAKTTREFYQINGSINRRAEDRERCKTITIKYMYRQKV
jgi:hypothetical protein